jgi:hypothetical protein
MWGLGTSTSKLVPRSGRDAASKRSTSSAETSRTLTRVENAAVWPPTIPALTRPTSYSPISNEIALNRQIVSFVYSAAQRT